MHEEEMRKILVYLNGFTDEERLRLAEITAVWLATGQIPPSTLSVLINVSWFKIVKTCQILSKIVKIVINLYTGALAIGQNYCHNGWLLENSTNHSII